MATDIIPGDFVRIYAMGTSKKVLVKTAHNYGTASDPVWYIQGDEYTQAGKNLGSVYWKQDADGGRVVKL